MKTVLMAAFEPFEGELVNASWEAVSQLHERMICGAHVVAKQLPCVFDESLQVLNDAMDELEPELVIVVGQANGRPNITVERVAINIDDARIPDNAGRQPIDERIVADGPAAYFATLPIKAIVEGIREADIPAAVSQTAGTFVCNHVLYGLLHRQAQQGGRGGFIHVPYLPQQAVRHPGAASMPLQTVVLALEMALSIALTVEEDKKLEGGATQ